MWLHLLAGSLFILLTSNLWNGELTNRASLVAPDASTLQIAGSNVQLFHRGSGRRDMVRRRVVAGRA